MNCEALRACLDAVRIIVNGLGMDTSSANITPIGEQGGGLFACFLLGMAQRSV